MFQGVAPRRSAPLRRPASRKALALMLLVTQFAPPRCFCGIPEPDRTLVRVR